MATVAKGIRKKQRKATILNLDDFAHGRIEVILGGEKHLLAEHHIENIGKATELESAVIAAQQAGNVKASTDALITLAKFIAPTLPVATLSTDQIWHLVREWAGQGAEDGVEEIAEAKAVIENPTSPG